MSKRTAGETLVPSRSVQYDTETILAIALKVKGEGFVPVSVLRDEFGPEKTTQGIAILYRDFRLFREVRRAWKEDGEAVLGYEWADRRFSHAETKKVPPQFNFVLELTQSMAVKYSDFQPMTISCRFVAPLLGSVPVKDKDDDPTNVFERDMAGNALILRYHQRAMMTMALPLIGKEQALARRIAFSIIRIPINGQLKTVQHGIVEQGRSGGKGLRRSECLPDQTEFTVQAMIPTSIIKPDEFIRALKLAGQHIGLSPGRSAGFGDFEVLKAE